MSLSMIDNQAIYGIEDDEPTHGRDKPRGKRRKPYKIESRYININCGNTVFQLLHLDKWWTHGRYVTEVQRDSALFDLAKKAEKSSHPWGKMEYRKG